MAKIPYTKPALTYQDQLSKLIERGLIVTDHSKALHLLENISYFRLSGYWYPFLSDKKKHIFKPDATFQKAFDLYCFDRELRLLVLRELEKIEVAVRAKMIYQLSHSHGAFWYTNSALFNNAKHTKSIDNIKKEYKRSDEEFIKAFRNKYSAPLPPSWMILEVTSFGTLSMLFKQLKPGHNKRAIAKYFGMDDKSFTSWLHSITYVRNICAHHTRLWNRVFSIQPRMLKSPKKQWLNDLTVSNKRCYFILSILLYLLQTINPPNQFAQRIDKLLTKYPNVDTGAMGFPTNWKNEPLWET